MHESIEQLAKEPGKLEELPGIGDRMAEHIEEIIKTGDYSLRQKLLKKFPATLLDIMNLQSLGPKKVAFLWSNFQAATVADVEKLARDGKLRDLPGFGEKSEQNILKAVDTHKRSTGRFRLDTAEAAAKIIEHIEKYPKGGRLGDSGGLAAARQRNGRRSRSAADLADGYTAQKHIDALAEHILKYPRIDQVWRRARTKSASRSIMACRSMCACWIRTASALRCCTSRDRRSTTSSCAAARTIWVHAERIRVGDAERREARWPGRTEEEIYAKLKLDYIPPEIRENTGKSPRPKRTSYRSLSS